MYISCIFFFKILGLVGGLGMENLEKELESEMKQAGTRFQCLRQRRIIFPSYIYISVEFIFYKHRKEL